MIGIKHTGIYVNDLEKMAKFYKCVFSMETIVENEEDSGAWLDELSQVPETRILVTKLITPQGVKTGIGDMIELVKLMSTQCQNVGFSPLMHTGVAHVAFGVEDIFEMSRKIQQAGGTIHLAPVLRENGKYLAFATDPENNWIELIQ